MPRKLCVLLFLLLPPALAAAADWIDLMPDEALDGWTRVPIPPSPAGDPRLQWRVDSARHILICKGDGAHEMLRYDKEFGDLIFHVEWRYPPREPGYKRYNSGVFVRTSKYGEIWYQAQAGLSGGYWFGDTIAEGEIKRFNLMKQMKQNRVKPAGEWNTYDIRAEGDKLTLDVNGAVVSEFSGCSLRKGYVGLEAENHEIEFRSILLKPLD